MVSSWELALDDVGAAIQASVRQHGWQSVGLMVGGSALHSQRLLRTIAALRERLGSVSVFTPRARELQPLRQASRLVLGRAVDLRTDLARVHHLMLLGGNQLDQGWAPGHAGQALLRRLDTAGRRRLRLCVADPRRSRLAARASTHLSIRPGTELYLLLGMASAMIRSGWVDEQHVRERTRGLDALARALEPWSPARAAELCGLSVADITGEAMRFSRAPTAAILASPQALGTPWSTLTAWAMLLLHSLTSNLLEPGGLYAHPGGALDASQPELCDSSLALALRRGLKVLICVGCDPVSSVPGGGRLLPGGLERLVCIDRQLHATALAAHWVLPSTHFFEEPELCSSDASDRHWLQWSSGLVVQPPGCRPPWELVAGLLAAGDPSGAGSAFAMDHPRRERDALAVAAAGLGMDAGVLAGLVQPQLTHTDGRPRGFDGGAVDRSRWMVHHPDGRLDLSPEPMIQALARHVPAEQGGAWPFALLSSARRDPAQGPWDREPGAEDAGVGLHPNAGFPQGLAVRVVTPHGSAAARVVLDEQLSPHAVDLPMGFEADAMALVDPTHLDPWAATAWTDGQPCRIESAEPSAAAAPKPLA